MARKNTYAFLTSDDFLMDVKASNPKQGYKMAKQKYSELQRQYPFKNFLKGKVLPMYAGYGQRGYVTQLMYKKVKGVV